MILSYNVMVDVTLAMYDCLLVSPSPLLAEDILRVLSLARLNRLVRLYKLVPATVIIIDCCLHFF